MIDRVGQQLGNYHVIRLLGRGGFAEVYLGEHAYLKSHAALKVLHTHLTDDDADQFVREAQTLARLAHPHIVRVLDFAVQNGVPFLVMEYAPGGTLRQRHPKETLLPLDTILPYVQQVASALQYAHDQRLMHRDIKPENMLLGSHGEVVLSDFGLAMFAPQTPGQSIQAMHQSLTGTISYLAPEQVQGNPGAASDQYTLGVVVYEWLCGSQPFSGSPIEIAMQHLSAPPPSLRKLLPDLSPALEDVVLRALAKEPQERFATVQDFAQAFEAAYVKDRSDAPLYVPSSDDQAEPLSGIASFLPAQVTTLIGREQEIMVACSLLRRPEVRLVTLTGTGGIGKTRLALQVAAELHADFAQGVCFVSLAPLRDSDLLVSAIAQALGIKEVGSRPLVELVHAFLKNKSLLLLLDNFEQLLEAATKLSDLLAACPHLKLLVTSRSVLHLQGEHELLVPPLALPDLVNLPRSEDLSEVASVALFLQRVQSVLPGFQLTATNARSIAELCIHLDGLPLALELAAARMKLFSPQALLVRLEHRLPLLTSGARDAPERQQTLRETIAWSYHLLTPEEQRLFRCLSVFVGGCTLEAVEAVCEMIGKWRGTVVNAVTSLLDQSLLRAIRNEGEEPRFMMLETIREYGLECLVTCGEIEIARQAHAQYYLALAEQAEPHLRGAEQVRWSARLEQERENLRAALSCLLEHARMEVSSKGGREYAKQALRLCTALFWFWYDRMYYRDGWSFLEQALAIREGVGVPLEARLLSNAGWLLWQLDVLDQAEALTGESLTLYRELGDTAGVAGSLLRLGGISRLRSQYAAARVQFEEAGVLFQQVDDTWSSGRWLTELARMATAQGEYDRAYALLEESLGLYQALGDRWRIAWVLYLLARVLFVSQSNLARAAALAEQSLVLYREVGAKSFIASPLRLLGEIHLVQGEQTNARQLAEESVAIFKEAGTVGDTAVALIALARIVAFQGDHAGARTLIRRGFVVACPCH